MSTSEAELPPFPDPQTGEPRPPNAPIVIGMGKETTQTLSGFGKPPEGFGPILETRGNNRLALLGGAGILCLLLAAFFTAQNGDFRWVSDPVPWGMLLFLAVFTILRDWNRSNLAGGVDWFRVNRRWVNTYSLAEIRLAGVLRGWTLSLQDTEGRALRVYINDLEANRDLWALVYNGMLHSAFHGATVNNTAAGMLRLRPGFEAMRYQERNRGPKIPDRTAWTILLVIVGVFAAIYFLRPDLLGPALAIFAGLVLLLLLIAGVAIAIARRHQRRQDAPRD